MTITPVEVILIVGDGAAPWSACYHEVLHQCFRSGGIAWVQARAALYRRMSKAFVPGQYQPVQINNRAIQGIGRVIAELIALSLIMLDTVGTFAVR